MTPERRTSLEFFQRFRDATPRFRDVLSLNGPLLAFWAVLVVAAVAFGVKGQAPVAPFVAGFVVGAALLDMRRLYDTVKYWPWLRGIIDWKEVERRLASRAAS